jgi:hypothetical protein
LRLPLVVIHAFARRLTPESAVAWAAPIRLAVRSCVLRRSRAIALWTRATARLPLAIAHVAIGVAT